jgi:hypothetical protein
MPDRFDKMAEHANTAYWDACRAWERRTMDDRLAHPKESPGPITWYIAAALRQAVMGEREACAVIAHDAMMRAWGADWMDPEMSQALQHQARSIADAIRARSEKEATDG